jgi:hypothetical protein
MQRSFLPAVSLFLVVHRRRLGMPRFGRHVTAADAARVDRRAFSRREEAIDQEERRAPIDRSTLPARFTRRPRLGRPRFLSS